MALKTGDKVKFLNESGGGFVTKIISPSMVEVSVADGFNIPYATRDLLKVDDQGAASRIFDEDFGKKPIDIKPAETHQTVSSRLFKRESLDLKRGIYLAFVPQDQKWLMTGLIDIYIVNYTDYEIVFSIFLNDGNQFKSVDYDICEVNNKFALETISREDINHWLKGHLQVLFIRKNQTKIISPLHKSFEIKGSKFFQENSYRHIDLLDSNAVVVEMVTIDYQEMISKNPAEAKDEETAIEPKARISQSKSLIEKHKTALLEAEIDLHISALKDDYNHMKPHEIIIEQMNYFNRTLEDAMLHQYQKIVYIHGIGNGTLKKRLKEELAGYDEIDVRDASFQQYGYGAIEIKIHYK